MLTIRSPQMAVFAEDSAARFLQGALAHVRRYFPAQCIAVGDNAVVFFLKQGIRRAQDYGFESEYDILRFLNLIFSLGSDFDQVAKYAWMQPYLSEMREMSPTTRMDALMEELTLQLEPVTTAEPGEAAPPEVPSSTGEEEFDGIVWKDDWDPNYVPVSIEPEVEPWERGPAPGTVPVEPWTDDDDWQEDAVEAAIEEESGR